MGPRYSVECFIIWSLSAVKTGIVFGLPESNGRSLRLLHLRRPRTEIPSSILQALRPPVLYILTTVINPKLGMKGSDTVSLLCLSR
jgi:hypothetical protein